jgi:hypothetical protein
MSTIDRVRIINPDQSVSVRDFAFSQICEMTAVLTKEQSKVFWDGKESVTTTADSHFAKAGSNLKYMGCV